VPDFLVTVLEDEDAHASQAPKAMAELIEASDAYAGELRRAGRLVDRGRFRPSKEGKRVRRDGDRLRVEDGPFAEEGKALGGYYLVTASSLAEAAELAARAPVLPRDEVDVLPVMKGQVPEGKESKPGKLFACVVLGCGKTEEARVEVMDRIDRETRGCFPEPSFLGGVRLESPTQRRRLAPGGERRAPYDGPFLESKEVIGGLFLVRMTSLDEVVRWAGQTRFVVHGALEIRELWRT
jgi:hypothetical protein